MHESETHRAAPPTDYAAVLANARAQLEDRVIKSPDDAEAWFNLGILLRDRSEYAAAELHFRKALEIRPTDSLVCIELGLLCRKRGELDAAAAWYRKALRISPESVNAHFNLGNWARDCERFEEAEKEYRLVLRFEQAHYGAWINLGYIYEQQVRYSEALHCYKRALELQPQHPGTYVNIGNLLKETNDIAGAIAAYRAALRLDPNASEAHHSLGLALLSSGEFAAGWREYEWRLCCHDTGGRIGVRVFPQPLWDGRPLDGKTIYVYGEQGLGDNIQFARFLPRLKRLGANVIYGCYDRLLGLFDQVDGVDTLVDVNAEALPAFDTYVALMSLPHLLDIQGTDVSAGGTYLAANPTRAARWRWIRDGHAPAVGLVWSSNTRNRHARLRSMAFEQLRPVLSVPSVTFYSLQIIDHGEAPPARDVVTLEPNIGTLEETAAIIANLDLVITIDTSIAHLAGAMGKEVWTFLPFAADWRWPRQGYSTAWYPTMTLFRQSRLGSWEEPVREVAGRLEARLKRKLHE